MEPLAEENERLKETIKLMEGNVQTARRDQDLAEAKARTLENYSKDLAGRLSAATEELQCKNELLNVVTEQLEQKSEQLESASKQLEQRSEELKNISEQKSGTVVCILCFLLLRRRAVVDVRCACRARCEARPAGPGSRAAPGGEGEGENADRQAGRGV